MLTRRFDELNRAELAATAHGSLVVLPTGATEQHGQHLPAGTDAFVVEAIASKAAAEAVSEIDDLIAPVLPFGSSHHHLAFGATRSLSTDPFFHAVPDLVRSLAKDGFRRVFLLNGHGGNDELLQLVASDAALEHGVHVAAGSYWTIAAAALDAVGAGADGVVPGHAGAFETSLILAVRPELVSAEPPVLESWVDPWVEPYRVKRPGAWSAIDGFTDSPARGSTEAGTRYLDAIVRAVAAFVHFHQGYYA